MQGIKVDSSGLNNWLKLIFEIGKLSKRNCTWASFVTGVPKFKSVMTPTLLWRHDERDGVSNHRRLDCLLKHLFRRISKEISKLRVTGLCEGNSSVAGDFPAQRASNAENVSIWWRHHEVQWPRKMALIQAPQILSIHIQWQDICVECTWTTDYERITGTLSVFLWWSKSFQHTQNI